MQNPVILEAVAFDLMTALLNADGKQLFKKGHIEAATDDEIKRAYQTALSLVKGEAI